MLRTRNCDDKVKAMSLPNTHYVPLYFSMAIPKTGGFSRVKNQADLFNMAADLVSQGGNLTNTASQSMPKGSYYKYLSGYIVFEILVSKNSIQLVEHSDISFGNTTYTYCHELKAGMKITSSQIKRLIIAEMSNRDDLYTIFTNQPLPYPVPHTITGVVAHNPKAISYNYLIEIHRAAIMIGQGVRSGAAIGSLPMELWLAIIDILVDGLSSEKTNVLPMAAINTAIKYKNSRYTLSFFDTISEKFSETVEDVKSALSKTFNL